MGNNSKKLTEHYVAYIDILGAKNFINSDNNSGDYLNKLATVYNNVINKINNNYKVVYNTDIKFKIFSDNIIIAIEKNSKNDETINYSKTELLISIVSLFQIEALLQSMLSRGGIVIEKLCIDELFVYGKALTKAYTLESELAIYPRVIISNDDVIEFQSSNCNCRHIHKDKANIHYINPFEVYFEIFYELKKTELEKIRNILIEKMNINNNDKIKQKVCWLLNEFNEFCKTNEKVKDYSIIIDYFPHNETYLNKKRGQK